MKVDFLIIGQGICGSLFSWLALKEGKSVLVYDSPALPNASKAAGGLVSPVTGRRYVTTWMADTVIPHALSTYLEIETTLGIQIVAQKSILEFHTTLQMANAFVERMANGHPYLKNIEANSYLKQYFNFQNGVGAVSNSFQLQIPMLLSEWRKHLQLKGMLVEDVFDYQMLDLCESKENTFVKYKDIMALFVIFCEGVNTQQNPFFKHLSLVPNKGEALWINAPDLPQSYVYKHGNSIVPMGNGRFWVGSSHVWDFENDRPTPLFLDNNVEKLTKFLTVPFVVEQHLAGIRPATINRRPLVERHPQHNPLCILNGMGSKGVSLAPFFADKLLKHLLHGSDLMWDKTE